MGDFYTDAIQILKEQDLEKDEFVELKKDIAKRYGLKDVPSDIQILTHASREDAELLKKRLLTKPTRTLSGVAPIAVMTLPYGCPHGKCVYCPGGPNSSFGDVPQSYTGHEPSTMRAIRAGYDPYMIVFYRLEQYLVTGHTPEKADVIVQGGTFPAMPLELQNSIIKDIFKAMNDFSDMFFVDGELDFEKFKEFFELPGDIYDKVRSDNLKVKILDLKNKNNKDLEYEKNRNENAKIRCIGLTIETKPDWGLLEHGNLMLEQGCTRVELGIQSLSDEVLKLTHRGHGLQESIDSSRILKDLGFKLNYHFMLGLPGTTPEKELEELKQLFTDDRFKPDMLKVYPTMVSKGTALFAWWKTGKYKPIDADSAAEIISEFKRYVPKWCRIMRVQRDIPPKVMEAGPMMSNLRQLVEQKCIEKGIKCNCIRCREVGRNLKVENPELTVTEYESSGGKEFFIAVEDLKNDVLIGFNRLRFPSQSLRPEITDKSGIIREIHVYGEAAPIGKPGNYQHKGYGKMMMKKAEDICRANGKNKLLVIAGVGVRQYFKQQLGYVQDGPYVSKKL